MIDYNKILEVAQKPGGVSMRKLQLQAAGNGEPVIGGNSELRRAVEWLELEGLVKRYVNGLVVTTPDGKKALKNRDVDLFARHKEAVKADDKPAAEEVPKAETAKPEPAPKKDNPVVKEWPVNQTVTSSDEEPQNSSLEKAAPAVSSKPAMTSSDEVSQKSPANEVKPFERELRYVVFKLKHLDENQKGALRKLLSLWELPPLECVVVESDWPNYEDTWRAVEQVAAGEYVSAADRVRSEPTKIYDDHLLEKDRIIQDLKDQVRRANLEIRGVEECGYLKGREESAARIAELERHLLEKDRIIEDLKGTITLNERVTDDANNRVRDLYFQLEKTGDMLVLRERECNELSGELNTLRAKVATVDDDWRKIPSEDELQDLVIDDLLALSRLGQSAFGVVKDRLGEYQFHIQATSDLKN